MANKDDVNLRRFECRFDVDLKDSIDYYAKKQGISRNEFLTEAAKYYIAYLQGDYDVPSAMVQRTNQLVDIVTALVGRVDTLENTTRTGIQSMIQLTRGDSYLTDDEND